MDTTKHKHKHHITKQKINHEIMNKKNIRTCEQIYRTKLNYTWNETSKYIPTKLNYTWNKTSKPIHNHQSVHCVVTPKVSQILWIVFIDWVLVSSLYTEWWCLQWKQHSIQNTVESKKAVETRKNRAWKKKFMNLSANISQPTRRCWVPPTTVLCIRT